MKIFKYIKQFFSFIFTYHRYVKLHIIEKQLKRATINQRVDKIIYKDIINKDMRKALRIDANSKYIPDDIKNKAEIKEMILARHGDRMNLLNIKITDDLRLV